MVAMATGSMPSAPSVRPSLSACFRHDIVAPQQLDLIGRQQWRGHELQERGLKLGECERNENKQAPALDRRQHELHQLLEAFHFGPAELVDVPGFCPALDRSDDGACDVAGEDRLKQGMASADQRQRRRHAGDSGELVEEFVFRAEQNRGAQDDCRGSGGKDQLLPGRLGTRIVRWRPVVGADRRHMNHARIRMPSRRARPSRRRRRARHRIVCRLRSNRMPTRLITTSASRTAASTEPRITQIGLHRVDLADSSERLQVARKIGAADCDADAVTDLGERTHHMAAEETGAAENGDQRLQRNSGHAALVRVASTADTGSSPRCIGSRIIQIRRPIPHLTSMIALNTYRRKAQVAELVDALVSGTSAARRGGSSPLLGTNSANCSRAGRRRTWSAHNAAPRSRS